MFVFENYREFVEFCQPYWVDGMGLDAGFEAAVEAMIQDLGLDEASARAEAEFWIVGADD